MAGLPWYAGDGEHRLRTGQEERRLERGNSSLLPDGRGWRSLSPHAAIDTNFPSLPTTPQASRAVLQHEGPRA